MQKIASLDLGILPAINNKLIHAPVGNDLEKFCTILWLNMPLESSATLCGTTLEKGMGWILEFFVYPGLKN